MEELTWLPHGSGAGPIIHCTGKQYSVHTSPRSFRVEVHHFEGSRGRLPAAALPCHVDELSWFHRSKK